MPNDDIELSYIYATLRKLKCVRNSELANKIGLSGKSRLDESIFPRRFLLKLLDARFADLDELAGNLVSNLFRRLVKKAKSKEESPLAVKQTIQSSSSLPSSKCIELDEYFHCCLYYLHDFFLELNWHEPDIETLGCGLKYIDDFFVFQKDLTNFGAKLMSPKSPGVANKSPEKIQRVQKSAVTEQLKSSLALGSKLESPMRKRRVRFEDTTKKGHKSIQTGTKDLDLKESHSVLALDLLLFSLSLFSQRLDDCLKEWASSPTSGSADLMILIRESKQKLRTNQLSSIAKQIKQSNDIYLTMLDYLSDLRRIYLRDYIVGIICAPRPGSSFVTYKTSRVGSLMQKTVLEVEAKVVLGLAEQSLQVLIDLVTSEMNLPPVEMGADTKSRSRDEMVKSRENYLNFMTSWLNVGDFVFGTSVQKKHSFSQSGRNNKEISTLANSGPFKSSTRLLAQMDNLNELMRDLLSEICDRIKNQQQLKYFLDLAHSGLDHFFDVVSAQLVSQLASARTRVTSKTLANEQLNDVKNLNYSIDLIAAKVRCLKFIQILTSIDKLIRETSAKTKVELVDLKLSSKLVKFTETCTQQTGSVYMS